MSGWRCRIASLFATNTARHLQVWHSESDTATRTDTGQSRTSANHIVLIKIQLDVCRGDQKKLRTPFVCELFPLCECSIVNDQSRSVIYGPRILTIETQPMANLRLWNNCLRCPNDGMGSSLYDAYLTRTSLASIQATTQRSPHVHIWFIYISIGVFDVWMSERAILKFASGWQSPCSLIRLSPQYNILNIFESLGQ